MAAPTLADVRRPVYHCAIVTTRSPSDHRTTRFISSNGTWHISVEPDEDNVRVTVDFNVSGYSYTTYKRFRCQFLMQSYAMSVSILYIKLVCYGRSPETTIE